MNARRNSAAVPLLIAALLLGVPLVAYVAGYFWLCELTTGLGMSEYQVRVYRYRLLAEIYRPAAKIENAFSPTRVITAPQSGPLLSRQ